MKRFVAQKTGGMKFKDLTKVNLVITACEATTGTLVVFSPKTTPDVLIADAVVASSSIQSAFKPQKFNSDTIQHAFFDDNSIKKPVMALDGWHPIKDYIAEGSSVYMWDGGNLGNTRMDIGINTVQDITDCILVGVTYTYDNSTQKIKWANAILSQTINIMMKATDKLIVKYLEAGPKYSKAVILSPKTNIGTTEFSMTVQEKDMLIATGRLEVSKYIING